jgi:type VI secretion system protein ImpG
VSRKYYEQELFHLRELAAEFARAHPALAPMLSGASQDPDTERLLEGTAFLTGMLRQKIDDEFPEIIGGLMQIAFPHYLRPIPAATIVRFTPKASLMESLTIPEGTSLDSSPVDGTPCTFRTTADTEVHPLRLVAATYRDLPGRESGYALTFEVGGEGLGSFRPSRLRLHLAGGYAAAADRQLHILRNLAGVEFRAEGGSPLRQGPEACSAGGFADEEGLFPYPAQSFPGFRILQEYFILPEKFLYLDLTGFEAWTDRGETTRFEVFLAMQPGAERPPRVEANDFALFAVPAVNLFPMSAQPIRLDHKRAEYRILPADQKANLFQVYAVEAVRGVSRGMASQRDYQPMEWFKPARESSPVYAIRRRPPLTGRFSEVFLQIAYPSGAAVPDEETLSIDLLCTNGLLPESLRAGDISRPTDDSPVLCDFTNLRAPTSPVEPPLGGNMLWRFHAHMSLNLLSLADPASLAELLRLYVFPERRDQSSTQANFKRIDGVRDFRAVRADRLVGPHVVQGHDLELRLHPDNFASRGDMHVFSEVMSRFLAAYAALNTFTRLRVVDDKTGESWQWQARTGERPLI